MTARIAVGHQSPCDSHHAASPPHTAFGNVTSNLVFRNVSNSVHKRGDALFAREGVRSDGFDDLDFTIRQIAEAYRFLMRPITNNIEAGPVNDALNYLLHIGKDHNCKKYSKPSLFLTFQTFVKTAVQPRVISGFRVLPSRKSTVLFQPRRRNLSRK